MTKSELIERLTKKQGHLAYKDVELAVKCLLEQMSQTLSSGDRIEIRGFGSFSLHYRPPRIGRNPKTGSSVALSGKYVPHFKPGKDLRERVDASLLREREDANASLTSSVTDTQAYPASD
ncbi:MAG TPA: integration host factor subunit beta [Chromatiaceae bacterium]|jgi:integration host factor subunit beta|nr:integration host factor subunit beta [Chromatiaceae bacterium]HIA09356.1 integration host factor subunit beta [Chromatiaceae bacterium]HIN81395.1 integration host factor subunit beta [Chromatiales bacterium]HIO13849.1 integration host factor subunit beta [Chromatiales bacterium]HIO53639.1 integration host factor subunit beta [Chromatiales bacterium]